MVNYYNSWGNEFIVIKYLIKIANLFKVRKNIL